MEELNSQKQAQWWCISFGQENMEAKTAKSLQVFFKRVTSEVVFGEKRVFLNVSRSPFRNSFSLFQTKLSKIAKKNQLNPELWQWGIGKSLAESWVQARWRTLSPDLLPIEVISDYLNPHESQRKNAEDGRRFRILRALGVNSLQDLSEIPEDVLLSQCGVWITEFCREYFSRPEQLRDLWLERATTESFLHTRGAFQLEDWIPEEYLEVS